MGYLKNLLSFQTEKKSIMGAGDSITIASTLQYTVVERMVSETVARLGSQELFETLLSNGLIDTLVKQLITGNFKGFLYLQDGVDKNNIKITKAVAYTKEKVKDIKVSTEVEVDKKIDKTKFDLILRITQVYESILNSAIEDVNLSKSYQIKLADIRSRVNAKETLELEDKVNAAIQGVVENREHFILDADDKIERTPSNLEVLKTQRESLFQDIALVTGFPYAFWSGLFSSGLGNSDERDEKAIRRAATTFYQSYLYGFFSYISTNIQPTLSALDKLNENSAILSTLQFDKFIDARAIYADLGLPLLAQSQSPQEPDKTSTVRVTK